MSPLSGERYYAELQTRTAELAGLVHGADLTLLVPACPDWTLRQLATHVGRAHRWAAQIVSTRSAEFIPFRSVPDGRFPDDPAQQPAWLTAGAARLAGAVRAAGGDPVWALGATAPASFWARRMTHETLVHTADAQLAAGQRPALPADIAADAIDEWLCVISGPIYGRPDPRAQALPQGRVLHVHTTDEAPAGTGEWLVRHTAAGVSVEAAHGKGDVALTGPAADVLLVLTRRLPAGDPAVTVFGDTGLLARWLAETEF
ncbi:MAG: maleylpyruvate isomerase family mycothiol-dependent enzyme [Streptosporangiaceae bacterium]